MNARSLLRAWRAVGMSQGWRAVRSARRRRRADAAAFPWRGRELARVPGEVRGADPRPGGGVVRFTRSSLRVRVARDGAVFCGWDGSEPEPSYALAGACPTADERAELEPDKDGGWRVVSRRVTVAVSRRGTVEVRTPGGVVLRRDLPPRWWEPAADEDAPGDDARRPGPGPSHEQGPGQDRKQAPARAREQSPARDGEQAWAQGRRYSGRQFPGQPYSPGSRWMQRSEVAADGRFFGLGGRALGLRLRNGTYRLWNTDGGPFETDEDPPQITMPVQLVVADAGTHLVFHDNSWYGSVSLHEGEEGVGSGHDRPGRCELHMSGGPVRYWVLTGSPSRVLRCWSALTGAPAVPPRWALGHQHALPGFGDEGYEDDVRRIAAEYREQGLPLRGLHLIASRFEGHHGVTAEPWRSPGLPALAGQLRAEGVRLVSAVDPAIRAEPGHPVYDSGAAAGVFVRDARGREVRGVAGAGESVFPDFTDPQVRKWWGGLSAERVAQGFAGVWHGLTGPAAFTACGEAALPLSARHALEGRGGDQREAHNVYALLMARAGFEALGDMRPEERPFLLSRSGWAGMQRYGGALPGSAGNGWPAMRASLGLVLGLGLCGVPCSGSDVGGSMGPAESTRSAGSTGTPSPELYLRWFQLAAYLPLFRTRGTSGRTDGGSGAGMAGPGRGSEGPGRGRVSRGSWGERVVEHARAALRERERLLPYFMTLAELASRTGAPYVRPLWWHDPRDRALRDCEDAFLLGDALLVAPVFEPGARQRAVPLPRGRWYDTATGEVYRGPGRVAVQAPLSRIPVLARAGSVLPVAGADGGIELEVWAPASGDTGSGVVVAASGHGWERPEVERFAVRLLDEEPVVTRAGGTQRHGTGRAVGYPVRVRGTGA